MRALPIALCIAALAVAQQSHPLDPLTKGEIAAAVEILRANGKLTDSSRFPVLCVNEPAKAAVLAGTGTRREAFAIVYERATGRTAEAVVDLAGRSVQSWKEVAGVQPSFMGEDYAILQQTVRDDSDWQAAVRKRGITDFEHVQIDPWAGGYFGFPDEEGRRIFRAVSLYRGTGSNAYARPIEGVVAYVDVAKRKVLQVVDSGVVPMAPAAAEFDKKSVAQRPALKPLRVTQSHGAEFSLSGNEVRWQNWRFRFGVHPREGLVLYTVGFEDHGRLRPILYRGSVSEMFVPYGDPSLGWFFRGVFDEGEYGLGQSMFPLAPGLDVPENATLVDAVLADEKGAPRDLRHVVALYERDGGVLWRHTDMDTSKTEARRARDLVLSWVATVGNYDYGFNWIFHQDGTLEMDVVLSGIMQTKGVAGSGDHHSHVIAKNLAAVHHQHFFNFRLDMDVDGPGGNSVAEWNAESMPAGEANRFGSAFDMQETIFRTESEAQRLCNLASSRMWRIFNSSSTNSLGQSAGYLLVPGANALPFASPDSYFRRRAGFLSSHLWVTPYDPGERNAAGPYIFQSKGGEGLPKWTAANRAIEKQDIVVWYTMGVTHIPRPEEWPIMNAHHAGFKLAPANFFTGNPALDVPVAH